MFRPGCGSVSSENGASERPKVSRALSRMHPITTRVVLATGGVFYARLYCPCRMRATESDAG